MGLDRAAAQDIIGACDAIVRKLDEAREQDSGNPTIDLIYVVAGVASGVQSLAEMLKGITVAVMEDG